MKKIIIVSLVIAALLAACGGKPAADAPVAAGGDGSFTVTVSVRCSTLLNNLDALDKDKRELVPADGVIYPQTEVAANEGETVFDVLQRTMRQAGIQMEFTKTPVSGDVYIKAIDNLAEFDAGALSGWMYSVNGAYQNGSCSGCPLKAGDAVEWDYSCDLGRDLGQGEE